ncbi:helix-turn-helix domain-containing protein [Streptomyces goshikiensis]|uniref:helix-turn-helix domain-containing protein n=1 Tax=Streptomyces goshikiensis TaxID=1942 RepID=UPI0037F24A80
MPALRARRPKNKKPSRPSLAVPVLGLPRVPKGIRLTGDDQVKFNQAVIKAYTDERQAPIRQIAGETGRAYATIHKILTKANVPLRPRGGTRSGAQVDEQPPVGLASPGPAAVRSSQ